MYTLLHALYQWTVIVVMHQYISKSIKDINIIIELHYYHHVHTGSGTHIQKLLRILYDSRRYNDSLYECIMINSYINFSLVYAQAT